MVTVLKAMQRYRTTLKDRDLTRRQHHTFAGEGWGRLERDEPSEVCPLPTLLFEPRDRAESCRDNGAVVEFCCDSGPGLKRPPPREGVCKPQTPTSSAPTPFVGPCRVPAITTPQGLRPFKHVTDLNQNWLLAP